MRIEGRCVAIATVEIDFDEKNVGVQVEELQDDMRDGRFSDALEKIAQSGGDFIISKVCIEHSYAGLYKVHDMEATT